MNKKIMNYMLENNAFKYNPNDPVTWSSGIISPFYLDNRVLLSDFEARDFIIQKFLEKLSSLETNFDVICGVAMAGIPWASIIADKTGLPLVYVRAQAKKHGNKNQIEGRVKPDAKVLVIEDLISTGRSSLHVVDIIRKETMKTRTVLSIFNYGLNSAKKNFKENNCDMISLIYLNELAEYLKDSGLTPDIVGSFQREN